MLNGQKRWIGNATFADVIIIWARSSETQQARCCCLRCCVILQMVISCCVHPASSSLPKLNCILGAGECFHCEEGHAGPAHVQDREQDCAAVRAERRHLSGQLLRA